MEIAPASSFSQVSALFNDTTENQRERELLGLFPIETPNIHLNSSDFQQAVSHSGIDVEFRTAVTHEGHRILNGPLQYPFQSTAQIFHHKFDPFYYDGSELDPNFNVQENLIGTPLGASTLEDPRMTYVKNMLQMRELHGANHPLDDSYINELYMVNAEKGANYYANQLDKLDASMSNYSRMGRYSNQKPLHDIQFSQNIATGAPIHEKHTARIEYQSPSDAGPIQYSRRKQRMQRVDDMTAPYSIVPTNISYRSTSRGSRSNTRQSGSELQSVTSSGDQSSISLSQTTTGDHNEDDISQITDDASYDRNLEMKSLGSANVSVTPSTKSQRNQINQTQTPEATPGEQSTATQAVMFANPDIWDSTSPVAQQNGFQSPRTPMIGINASSNLNTAERDFLAWHGEAEQELANLLTVQTPTKRPPKTPISKPTKRPPNAPISKPTKRVTYESSTGYKDVTGPPANSRDARYPTTDFTEGFSGWGSSPFRRRSQYGQMARDNAEQLRMTPEADPPPVIKKAAYESWTPKVFSRPTGLTGIEERVAPTESEMKRVKWGVLDQVLNVVFDRHGQSPTEVGKKIGLSSRL